MLFSMFARKIAVGFCLAVGLPAVGIAQTSYSPQGGERAIGGALAGDQVRPRLSINAGGGYLVWQDNNTDGDGWGISARALDSNLSGFSAPFRVNIIGKWDQENPQVALLNNGGAVFVWQGGRQGFQHIYARFLTSSNTWATGDVMVNSSTNTFQINPAVTVLMSGNVVVVYATYNASTMQDVYAQIFSPGGVKIGGGFQLNQTTPYNQRTPAVAALKNGGFVTAWVSEQQRTPSGVSGLSGSLDQLYSARPSVDIYARLFNSTGSPSVDEFLVNANSNVCANPCIAMGADGNGVFAWGEKDGQVRNNSWDVYVLPFSVSASGSLSLSASSERRVNTQLYGDQYSPQISALGTDYLMVWTSMGQDGDHEGVYGQFLKIDGSLSGGEFRVNTTTVSRQKEQALASDQSGRFLAAWTGFAGINTSFDLYSQVYASTNFVPPVFAANYQAPVFVASDLTLGQPGSDSYGSAPFVIVGSGLSLTVTNAPVYIASANDFAQAAGTYTGLFFDTNGVTPATSGYFTLTTSPSGTNFTAKLLLAGKSYGGSTVKFDQYGKATFAIGSGAAALKIALQMDLTGGDQIRGTVSSANWGAVLLANRQVFNPGNPAPSFIANRQFTLLIPGGQNSSVSPSGTGFVTNTVGSAGSITWGGSLADGMALVKQSSSLSKSGLWPLYYYGNGEFLMSWVQFPTNAADASQSGHLIWIKSTGAANYKAGFTKEVLATGAAYVPPPDGQYHLSLNGAGLAQPLTCSVQIAAGAVTGLSTNTVKVKLSGATGFFNGSVTKPSISFQGMLLPNGTGGPGYFINNNQSGVVNLSPVTSP